MERKWSDDAIERAEWEISRKNFLAARRIIEPRYEELEAVVKRAEQELYEKIDKLDAAASLIESLDNKTNTLKTVKPNDDSFLALSDEAQVSKCLRKCKEKGHNPKVSGFPLFFNDMTPAERLEFMNNPLIPEYSAR